MSHPLLERRRRQRDAWIELARRWAGDLARRMPVRAVVVFGSVARGDFNKWSDVDVLVVADDLPATGRERLALLHDSAPPGLQPLGWTSEELSARRRRHDPIALESDTIGVVIYGSLPSS